MARRRVARDKNGKPVGKRRAQGEDRGTSRRKDGRRRRGFAGADTINVSCPPGEGGSSSSNGKKKFPWGTIFITGVVTAAGSIVAYKAYEHFSNKGKSEARQSNPEGQSSTLSARDMLLMTSPGALENMSQHHPMLNQGPSERELLLLEKEAALREEVAELKGFLMAQQAASQAQASQRQDLSMMLDAMDDED